MASSIVKLDVKGDVSRVMAALNGVQKKVVEPAASKAINDTLTSVRAESASDLRAAINVRTVGAVKKALTIVRARQSNLHGEILAKQQFKWNAADFMKRAPTLPKKGRQKGGITFYEHNKTTQVPSGFLVRGRYSGKIVAIMRRKTVGRSKIEGKWKWNAGWARSIYATHYLPEEFLQSRIVESMQRTAGIKFKERFDHEMKYRLEKLAGKANAGAK